MLIQKLNCGNLGENYVFWLADSASKFFNGSREAIIQPCN
jgi:hypothetical protein